MKQFAAFIQKEFFHIFRDVRTMMILLVMPVVQIILFGFAITTEVNNVRIAIFDPSKDAATRQLTERLEASRYFTIVRILDSPDTIDEIFRRGEAQLVVVFGDRFQKKLQHTGEASVQLLADATDPNQSTTLTGYASSIIGSYQQELTERQGIPYRILLETRMLYNPQIKSAYSFVPGVMGLIVMLICAMMTSIAIVREKETGTMEVLLASPMPPIYLILAKAVPYLVISIFNMGTILLLSVFVLHVPIAGSFFGLAVISILFILVALALGLMISSAVETQVAAMLVSGAGLMTPVMMLSGMIFPIESMPPLLQWFSALIPARWYIAAVRKIMIQGLDLRAVWLELSVLTAMAAALVTISLKMFKIRLNN